MSKKKKSPQDQAPSEPSFEEALAQLQQIVADLEDGSLSLAESIERFEEGTKLLRACYGMLEGAEQKIQMLTGTDADGNPVLTEFDAPETQSPKTTAGRTHNQTAAPSANQAGNSENHDEDAPNRLF